MNKMEFFNISKENKQLTKIDGKICGNLKPKELNIQNFIEISPTSLGSAYFLDGGIQEIFSTYNQSFYLLRFAYVKFKNEKRISHEIFQTFIKTKNLQPLECEISNELPFFQNKHIISAKDNPKETFISQIRRIFELKLAIHIAQNMNQGELLVLDGSLCPTEYDLEELKQLINISNQKKINLIGFSKNSQLKSQSGAILNEEILTFSKSLDFKRWVCLDVFSDSTFADSALKITTSFAYLHPLSNFSFRIDHLSNPLEALSRLSTNSLDGTFLGYPYGLIIADKLARVKNEEKSYLYSKYFLSKNLIERQNPHEILDTM